MAVIDTDVPPVLTPEVTLAFARREDRATELAKRGSLSDREREVLFEVFCGLQNGTIAQRLQIAERTVKFHISNINKKLRVTNRGQLMALLAGDDDVPPTPHRAPVASAGLTVSP